MPSPQETLKQILKFEVADKITQFGLDLQSATLSSYWNWVVDNWVFIVFVIFPGVYIIFFGWLPMQIPSYRAKACDGAKAAIRRLERRKLEPGADCKQLDFDIYMGHRFLKFWGAELEEGNMEEVAVGPAKQDYTWEVVDGKDECTHPCPHCRLICSKSSAQGLP